MISTRVNPVWQEAERLLFGVMILEPGDLGSGGESVLHLASTRLLPGDRSSELGSRASDGY
jgi:hypothetical protein